VTTGGAVTEYSLYTGAPGSKNLKLTDIAFGSDGSIYFTERNANAIGRLVP
jgi:streptogramin lyase